MMPVSQTRKDGLKRWIAASVLGLPAPNEQLRQARAIVRVLIEDGFTLADIGRALGYKDYKSPQGRYSSIQNEFSIHARNSGFLKGVLVAVGCGYGSKSKDIREKRAHLCRGEIMKMLEQGMSREESIARANGAFTLTEIGEALKLSRERIRQLRNRVAKDLSQSRSRRYRRPSIFEMVAGEAQLRKGGKR